MPKSSTRLPMKRLCWQTCSLLPVIRTFASVAGVDVVKSDTSVSTRILAEFSDYLKDDQKVPDNLAN